MFSSRRFLSDNQSAAAQHRRTVDSAHRCRAGNLPLFAAPGHLNHSFSNVPHAVKPSLPQAADAPFDRNVTVEETERLSDPPGCQIIVSRHGSSVEKGARIQIGVATTIDDKGGQVFACRSILMHVALPLHGVPLENAGGAV